jgi:hypothetical protein
MPSPFPGMDPYLEDPVLWPSVHTRLVTYLGDVLTELLPPRYVASINERLSVSEPDRELYPDGLVLDRAPLTPPSTGGTATVLGDPPDEIDVQAEEIAETFVEILAVSPEERVVAVIEVLSPSNKAAGTRGREQYRQKQRQVLSSAAHLMEIDLLRRGEHTVALGRDPIVRRGPYDYLVSLSRGDQRRKGSVWRVLLRNRLPQVLLPLLPGDAVLIDLQTLMNQCYDRGGYARRLDYQREPVVVLHPADAAWADAMLRERGLRS